MKRLRAEDGKRVQVAKLVLDPENLRKHAERDITSIAASLERHGQLKNIVVQMVDGALCVRAGNGTVLAARRLGWKTLFAVTMGDDIDEGRDYAYRDNRTAELSAWDVDALGEYLEERHAWEDDDAIEDLGFSREEYQQLVDLSVAADDEEPDDDTGGVGTSGPSSPRAPKPFDGFGKGSGTFDVFHGDCLDLLRGMESDSVDAIVTDPPYGMSSPGESNRVRDRVLKAFADVGFPQLYQRDSEAEEQAPLPRVSDRRSPLRCFDGPTDVNARVGMPEGAIDLDSAPVDLEVQECTEASGDGVSDGDLAFEGDSETVQFLGDFILDPGDNATAIGKISDGGMAQLFASGFRVPVVVTGSSSSDLLCDSFGASWLGDHIRDIADARRQASASTSVMTLPGTVLGAMLGFSRAEPALELRIAEGAANELPTPLMDAPKLVRARSAASRLSTMAKPFGVRVVEDAAGRAIASLTLWLPKGFHMPTLASGGFMGRSWDAALPDPRIWREALRVAKPGAHIVAFGAPRLYHRLACDIEDAGWEMRDCLSWLFGSGFPKSLDVASAIDRQRDDREEILEVTAWIREARDAAGKTNGDIDDAFGFRGMAGHWTSAKSQPAVPTVEQIPQLLSVLGDPDVPERIRVLFFELNGRKGTPGPDWLAREVIGSGKTGARALMSGLEGTTRDQEYDITAPASEDAKRWAGWGTALKPAWEPIALARKPLAGTVAHNVVAIGTGALNVDACRIAGAKPDTTRGAGGQHGSYSAIGAQGRILDDGRGRWPANIALDEAAAEQVDAIAGQDVARFFYCPKASASEREAGLDGVEAGVVDPTRAEGAAGRNSPRAGAGRHGGRRNVHPTVKPIALMRWLVRLVTPPGGTVLDPFTGSGSTGCATVLEGFTFQGAEMDPKFVEIARKRIAHFTTEAG